MLNELADDPREDASVHVGTGGFDLGPGPRGILGAWDGGEADIVLLNEGGVEGVEVEEEHKGVIEPSLGEGSDQEEGREDHLGLQHETTTIFGLLLLLVELGEGAVRVDVVRLHVVELEGHETS